MKRLGEHTDDELLTLDEQGIQDLIDYECAARSIKLLPTKPTPPDIIDIGPTTRIWIVCGLAVKSLEDATRISDLLSKISIYECHYISGPSYKEKLRLKSADAVSSVTTKIVFDEDEYEKYKEIITKNEAEKAEYKEKQRLWDDISHKQKDVRDRVFGRLKEAQQKVSFNDKLRADFHRYLTLTGGDKNTAMKFLIDVHKDEDLTNEYPDLINELAPDYFEKSTIIF